MKNVLQTLPQKLISILRNRKHSIFINSNLEKVKPAAETFFQTNVTYYKNDGSKFDGHILFEYVDNEFKIVGDSLSIELGAS